jgi:hypothetical protein
MAVMSRVAKPVGSLSPSWGSPATARKNMPRPASSDSKTEISRDSMGSWEGSSGTGMVIAPGLETGGPSRQVW